VESKQPMSRMYHRLHVLMAVGLVVFLVVLPFHLVVKRLIPGPAGTYWKEILLGLLGILWAIECLRRRRLLLSDTPLDLAVLAYLGLLLVRFVLDQLGWIGSSTELATSAWGLYVSALYVPLFWLVPTALRPRLSPPHSQSSEQSLHHDPTRAKWLAVLLVGVGGVVAVGGLAEFVLNVPLWPSDELLQRQGFADMYIYGTHVRRVYFTFDSPTALANTLALLLPLALVLTLLARRTWAGLAAGLAAILMAACIVVTFSRGIWVATALSLLVMGLLSGILSPSKGGFVSRNRRVLLAAVGALAVIGLTWGLVTVLQSGEEASADRGVVELSPAAYEAAPVTAVSEELLRAEPVYGEAVAQTWTLLDPITGQDDVRAVVYEHPSEDGKVEITYRIKVPEAGALRFAIALSPEVWSPEKGDGASFQIYLTEPDTSQEGQFIFDRYINPKHNPSDRRWRSFLVDLAPWAGHTVHISLITEDGPAGDRAYDWAGWAEPQVVSVESGYFESAQTENAILRHTGSILDWAQDETNRDRLAAWSLAIDAWRAAPVWGSGLGSTGVAALRTNPEHAFVTESQVLKALVELGLPGLLVLTYLLFQIARVGWRAYRTSDEAADPTRRVLLLGIMTSLLVIFIEGWVYQNLEVKQVNAYFWTMVGTLALLAGGDDE